LGFLRIILQDPVEPPLQDDCSLSGQEVFESHILKKTWGVRGEW
jgi:hypothetical protein